MTEILLQTKLFVPQTRPYLVPRPRLIEKIDSGINGRITLISAPAGFGKTTLMTAWLNNAKQQSAWYSLDEYDNDVERFLRYFIAAWQTIFPDCGADAQNLLQSEAIGTAPRPPELVLTTLLNEITSLQDEAIFVIDDFHLIEDETLLNAMNFWIDHAPPNVHTVLISRTNPPLSLSKWRVRGQLNDINSTDLQFSTTEAADFLRQVMGLDLATEDIRLLAQKTDGWIASLQLVALSLQGASDPHEAVTEFTGSDRQMMAYLLEEVWQKQPAEIQQFLLQTAVFHRFNVSLCTVVTEFSNSRQLIDQLDQNNLFLRPLDSQQNWYCYHPIFTEFLQKRQQETNPEQYQSLHEDASAWFAKKGFVEEAIHHAIAAGLYDTAAQYILDQANETMWQQNRSHTLRSWTHQLPDESLYALPELTAYSAWTYILHGESAQLNLFLNKAEQFWTANDIEVPTYVQGEIAILRGEMALAYGRFAEAIDYFAQAETQVTTQNRRIYTALLQVQGFAYRINGDIEQAKTKLLAARSLAQVNEEKSISVYANYDYGKTCVMAGQLTEAEQIFRQVTAQTPPDKYISNATYSFVYGALGELLLHQNQLTTAHEHVEKSIELGYLTSENNPMIRQGKIILALIKQAQGNWVTSQAMLAESMRMAQAFPDDRTTAFATTMNALAYLLQGEVEPVRQWLENRLALLSLPRQADSIPKYQCHEEQVVLARFLMLESPHKAIAYLEKLHTTAVTHQWHHNLLQINILLALTQQKNNNSDAALAALADALEFAHQEGYVYPFIREGSEMAQLLRLALLRGVAPDAIGRVQAAFMPTAVSAQPLIEPLTERELEILNLMADGHTNPEIARALFLATGTVAKYSNNIYAKLAVRNRTEATNRAKELGLIA